MHLCRRGIGCHVLEQKPYLGGRAYSFRDGKSGETIDNGQHLLIAGYHRTFEFMKMIGTDHLVDVQPLPVLTMHDPERGFREFSIPSLPPPVNVAVGILRTRLVSLPDRLSMLRAGLSILHPRERHVSGTVEEWLNATGQPAQTRSAFWNPLTIAIANELPHNAAARPFVSALRSAFLSSRDSARLAFPKVGLTQLYADGARDYVTHHGGSVSCSADVAEVLLEGDRVRGVRLRDGSTMEASAVVITVPPYRLPSLLPGTFFDRHPAFKDLDQAGYSPIVSTHLWFKTDFMPHKVVGLIGRTTQWVFNRRRLGSSGEGGHVSTVISAAYDIVSRTNDEIIRLSVDDIRSVYGDRIGEPIHAVVIREKRATLSINPSTEILRPSQKTAIPNLFLAGDWTETGFPATIEGAVTSARRCADMITSIHSRA